MHLKPVGLVAAAPVDGERKVTHLLAGRRRARLWIATEIADELNAVECRHDALPCEVLDR